MYIQFPLFLLEITLYICMSAFPFGLLFVLLLTKNKLPRLLFYVDNVHSD